MTFLRYPKWVVLKIKITVQERKILIAFNRNSPVLLVRLKAQAVMAADQELSSKSIALNVGKGQRAVERWLGDWNMKRTASIFSGHTNNNNAGKLTKEQQAQIKEVLSQPPSAYGIPKEMWDVPLLKNYISAQFDVVYESDESYYFLLRFSGLSFKYPDTFDRKRDEQFINKRMRAIAEELLPLLHRDDWEVFACDEVKMQQDAIIRRCWLKKGQRSVIKVNRDKQSQSYIGFLNQRTFKCHLYEMSWQNSDEVLKAMEQFLKEYPDKRIAIVWDNAPFHKSQKIKEQLKKHGIMEKVHLIAMPPYAPDENPIEHVWNSAKQAVANIQRNTFTETKQAFSDYVASRPFHYSFSSF
jgi:transposase/ribulose bisphosphate carboxylase small subunit